MKVLISDNLAPVGAQILKDAGIDIDLCEDSDIDSDWTKFSRECAIALINLHFNVQCTTNNNAVYYCYKHFTKYTK